MTSFRRLAIAWPELNEFPVYETQWERQDLKLAMDFLKDTEDKMVKGSRWSQL